MTAALDDVDELAPLRARLDCCRAPHPHPGTASITHHGVPAGARHERRVRVLVGRTPERPAPTYRPHRDRAGRPIQSAPRPASRVALADVLAGRSEDRNLHIYQLGTEWHVLVLDGLGRWIVHATAVAGLSDLDTARKVAGQAWAILRPLADEFPDRWVRP